MSNSVVGETAEAVRAAIRDSGRSKQSISDETGIPYSTLNRKVQGKTEFSFSELFLIAQAVGVHPSTFTPPAFQSGSEAA
jgi:lambda repressor-like predicted transcriptional regulator